MVANCYPSFMKETLNRDRLNFWISENGPRGVENLAYKTGIGFYTMRRIVRGEKEPRDPEKLALLQATGLKRDELFTLTKQEKSA